MVKITMTARINENRFMIYNFIATHLKKTMVLRERIVFINKQEVKDEKKKRAIFVFMCTSSCALLFQGSSLKFSWRGVCYHMHLKVYYTKEVDNEYSTK